MSDLRYFVMMTINFYCTPVMLVCAVAIACLTARLLRSFRPVILCVAALALIHGITTADSLVGYDLFSIPAQYEMN